MTALGDKKEADESLAILFTESFPTIDLCLKPTTICTGKIKTEKYIGMEGRFESLTPIKKEYNDNIFKIIMKNGNILYLATEKDDPFDDTSIVRLSTYKKKKELIGKPIIDGSSITVSKVTAGYGFDYTLSTGQTFGESKFKNIALLLKNINKDNELDFLKLIELFDLSRDELEDIVFISLADNYLTSSSDKPAISPYIGFNNNTKKSWIILKIYYEADSWLFINSVLVKADEDKKEYKYLKFKRDNSSGTIWEWNESGVSDEDILLLKKVANSEKTTVRFYGKTYNSDRIVSSKQKKQILGILSIYSMLNRQSTGVTQ